MDKLNIAPAIHERKGHTPGDHIRKVGRYLFYAPCALGLAVLVAAVVAVMGIAPDTAKEVIFPVFFVAFLALRDIEKNAEARAAITKAEG